MVSEPEREWDIEPYHDVPVALHAQLPPRMVPVRRLRTHPAALRLAELCRRAFRSYLLSPEWLNSRAFDDNPFRYRVEYVPYFHERVFAQSDAEDETLVVDLETIALGLKELLEQLKPRHYVKPSTRAFARKFRADLLRRLGRKRLF